MRRAIGVVSLALVLGACGRSGEAATVGSVGRPVSDTGGDAPATTPPTTPAPAPTTTEPLTSRLPVPEGDEWEVVFVDDFDGEELDDVWNTCYWWQVDGGCTIESNDEEQWYRPEGVSLGEGDLRLRATDDAQRTTDGDRLPYRSGMVTTGPRSTDDEATFAFTYGQVSVRALVPASPGTWPAVWLLSADKTSLPEIDIFEWYGNDPDVLTSHVHNRVDGEARKERIEVDVEDHADDWHVYTVTWLPDRVVFELDGVETGRVTDPELVPSTPMYLIANLAMGGVAGDVDDDALPVTFRIDEIVVSQWSGR